ncbi:MAG: hypothetical protein J5I50_00590 [Chitinophagaceae bacterium]|nr:hypothetical protein [Chitinophagaceae bacterium]
MSNEPEYNIVIQNSKLKTHIKLGYAFVIMSLISFGLLLLIRAPWKTPVAGFAVTIIYFLLKALRKDKTTPWVDQDIFFLYGAAWLWHSSLMAILLVLIGVLFKITLQPFRFIFTKEGVRKDFFPKKNIEWSAFSGIILKNGILTLDYKDNRLLQAPIENPESIDEQEFNAFVTEQLNKSQVSVS